MKLPRWAEIGRMGWTHTGSERPAFAETPGPGQESVWDYPRPPCLVGDDRRVQVAVGNVVIADTTGFYAANLRCLVDGTRVKPQPGGFYGGWITPELVGPFKGEHGSSGW